RMRSRNEGAFSQRETVGCEHRSMPVSGSRPQASLNVGSLRNRSRSSAFFVAAGDCENPGTQNIGQPMDNPAGIAIVRDHCRKPLGEAKPPLRSRQQHDAAIRAEASAVKGGGDLFALYRWKRKRQQIIVGGGGRGALQSAARIGFSNQILRQIKSLRYTRQPVSAYVMNKTG